MFVGIIKISQQPQRASYTQLFPFEWRGRERGEGEMSFGPRNRGWIKFHGHGRIEGAINCYGMAQFSGQKVGDDDCRKVWDMQVEWHGYNRVAYDRESAK